MRGLGVEQQFAGSGAPPGSRDGFQTESVSVPLPPGVYNTGTAFGAPVPAESSKWLLWFTIVAFAMGLFFVCDDDGNCRLERRRGD